MYKCCIGVLCLYLKKAFDTVDHHILLTKIKNLGLKSPAVSWVKLYLEERTQVTMCNNSISNVKTIKMGVPQGSVLGPLLSVIYVNDLPNYIREARCHLYTDDAAISVRANDPITMAIKLNDQLTSVNTWFLQNKLTLNVLKTKMMIFGTPHKLKGEANLPLHINNEIVENVNVFKYLGVFLDKNLNFEYHIERVYKKTCSKVGLLKKVWHFIDHSTALTLYKSLVLPHIDYCDVVYMTAKHESLNKLLLAQNVACRTLLLADRYCSVEEMHTELKLQFLHSRREFHFVNLCHKNIFVNDEHTGLASFFNLRRDENCRVSRHATEYDVAFSDIRSNVGRKSIGFRGPHTWNHLCNDLKCRTKFSEFVSLWKRICFSNFENHPA